MMIVKNLKPLERDMVSRQLAMVVKGFSEKLWRKYIASNPYYMEGFLRGFGEEPYYYIEGMPILSSSRRECLTKFVEVFIPQIFKLGHDEYQGLKILHRHPNFLIFNNRSRLLLDEDMIEIIQESLNFQIDGGYLFPRKLWEIKEIHKLPLETLRTILKGRGIIKKTSTVFGAKTDYLALTLEHNLQNVREL